MPCALESLACSAMRDFAFAGASNGEIYIIDMTVAAIGISAANAVVGHSGPDQSVNSLIDSTGDGKQSKSAAGATSAPSSAGLGALPKGVSILSGHSRAVTSLVCSADNTSVLSGSEDGSVRVWDQWSRQCMREVKPLNKTAITNVMVSDCRHHMIRYAMDATEILPDILPLILFTFCRSLSVQSCWALPLTNHR
jgi:WD40 repeat protein